MRGGAALLRRFGNASIRTKYLIAAAFLLVMLLMGGVYICMRVYAISYGEHIETARSDFDGCYHAIGKFEERMLHLATLFQANDETVSLLSDTDGFELNQYLRAREKILPLLYTMLDGSDDYYCRLYVDSSLDLIDYTSRILGLGEVMDEAWAREAMAGWGHRQFLPGQKLGAEDPALIAPIRDLADYKRLVGLLRIDLSHEALANLLEAPQARGYVSCCLMTPEGEVAAASGEADSGAFAFSAPPETLDGFEAMTLNTATRGRDTVFYRSLPSSRWQLIMVVHHDQLFASIFPQLFTLTFIGCLLALSGILCALPILAFTSSCIRHFYLYVQGCNADTLREIPPRLEPVCNDEIGKLVEAHNGMLERIGRLVQERERREREMRRLEVSVLQAQIKPHFLYNTLEAIAWMAKMNQPDKVESTVRSLTRFYRLCLSRGRDVLTLAQELEIVRHYFTIQCMRYAQRFRLAIDVPEEMEGLELPKITLQPLVENALVHGILESGRDDGEIRIFGRVGAAGQYELCVADSGAHFPRDKWEQALHTPPGEGADEPDASGEGYGLRNVERRLCLFFRLEAVLYLDGGDPAYTRVVLPFDGSGPGGG